MRRHGVVERWGRIDYDEAHARQLRLVERRRRGEIPDTLVLCEHDPVITAGRAWRGPLPPGLSFPVHAVERGGELTYHGPGQLVGYPVFRLCGGARDIHLYLDTLQGALLDALDSLGVKAEGPAGRGVRGVWVAGRKVASMGIAVRRWVTYHGFALNVRVDPEVFGCIRPCGLDPGVMTSLHLVRRCRQAAGERLGWRRVEDAVIRAVERRFALDLFERDGGAGAPAPDGDGDRTRPVVTS